MIYHAELAQLEFGHYGCGVGNFRREAAVRKADAYNMRIFYIFWAHIFFPHGIKCCPVGVSGTYSRDFHPQTTRVISKKALSTSFNIVRCF
jgi:hypothetical protein